eukprot:2345530-Prymnesium_polylepis.1
MSRLKPSGLENGEGLVVSRRGPLAAVKALGATMPPLMLATRASGTVRGEATHAHSKASAMGDGGRLTPYVDMSAHPVGGTNGGGRSAAGQLGVAVVSTRSH